MVYYLVMDYKIIEVNGVQLRISSMGKITALSRQGKNRHLPEREPKPSIRLGYHRVYIGGSSLTAHRLVAQAWLPDYSEDLQVDHIDGDRANNHPSNLRMVTNAQNQMGRVNYPRGSCKYRGVSLFKPSGKYVARICKDQKIMHIGYFKEAIDAAKAYDSKAKELGFFPEALNFQH